MFSKYLSNLCEAGDPSAWHMEEQEWKEIASGPGESVSGQKQAQKLPSAFPAFPFLSLLVTR